MRRFNKVLVANRGEIACRIFETCRREGLQTVAVYSDADWDAPHVRMADEAVHIGPTPASESYLRIDAIVDAARRTGAQAIHPGYGFLSERSELARAVAEAGLTLIGPSAAVMEAMGRKDKARDIAVAAGVPVVPVGENAGFPMLVKAAAGGGGKGMRIVRSAEELDDAVAAAKREAQAAFGDDTMLYERYVEDGRHIEVQIMADEYGNVLHFGERDCSVQRRHQKVIEEAPSAMISQRVRNIVLSSAKALASQVGYVGAGTVEFLVAGEEVFFLEMNTRLQVEHPVTEAVFDVDLVELQLRVALGESLEQYRDRFESGYAMEARVYAEDPFQGFLPQAGTARVVQWPSWTRVDHALDSGQRVTTAYDPMLGKIIVSGATRDEARRKLVQALDETAILGLTTNVGFLRQLAASDAFRDGEIHTAWLDQHPDAFEHTVPERVWALAARAVVEANRSGLDDPFGCLDGWRSGAPRVWPQVLLHHGSEDRLVALDGRPTTHPAATRVTSGEVQIAYQGQTYAFRRPDASGAGADLAAGDGAVTAPMPGTVLDVRAAEGDQVEAGQTVVVIEAMKMELALTAPFSGQVASIAVAPGTGVDLGAVLFVVEADDAAESLEADA